MVFVIVIDISLSILSPGLGHSRTNDSTYLTACQVIGGFLKKGVATIPRQQFILYRGTELFSENIKDVEDEIKKLKNNTSLTHPLNLGKFFHTLSTGNRIKKDDIMLVFTDASRFKADITHYSPCRTRFVVLQNDRSLIDKDQIEEFENISSASYGLPCTIINNERYRAIFLHDFVSISDLIHALVSEFLVPVNYYLNMGNFSTNITLDPSSNEDPSGNIQIIGFCKSWNLVNSPIISHHYIISKSNISKDDRKAGDVEIDSNDSNGDETSSYVHLLAEALHVETAVALCRFQSGQFAAITSTELDKNYILVLNKLPKETDLPDYIPSLNSLHTSLSTNDQGEDLHITEKKQPLSSFDGNAQSWTTAHGINNDVQKLIRMLKKLPDRLPQFYQEVNRFRDYAVTIGMFSFLVEMGNIIRKEIESMSDTSQKHGKYIAAVFEMKVVADAYTEIAALTNS